MKEKILATFFALAVLSCSNSDDSPSGNATAESPHSTEAPNLNRTDFMTGLSGPWDLAFLPDGTLFFSEKCKGLSVRKTDGSLVHLFGTTGASLVANDLFCQGQSGANGIALDPQFESNRYIYMYMSSSLSTPRSNRVVRLRVAANLNSVSERTDIITDISYKNSSTSWGGAGSHSGGRIRFGPDGFLYVTTGDNHSGTIPQDLTKLGGKILRVDRNGSPAPGNNPPMGSDPRIYAYGFRNVQGIDFRPGSGRPFVSEHGPGHSDEVTALSPGGNGGWDPKPEAGVTCAENYCGYISNKIDGTPTPMTDLSKFPQALRSTYQVADSAGMGPCAFLVGSQWKAWNGALAVGIMGTKVLDILLLSSDLQVGNQSTPSLPQARVRSLVQGPDGALYVAVDEGSIWKITPQ